MFRSNILRAAVALAILGPGSALAQIADPAKFFAKEPDYADPTMSPTGDYVAVETPDGTNRALALIKITGTPERNLFRFHGSTDGAGRPVRKQPHSAVWTDDARLVVFEAYDYGAFGNKFSSGNIYATSADAKDQVQLFGYVRDDGNKRSRLKDSGLAQIQHVLPDLKGQVLFRYDPGATQASQRKTAIYRVDTHSGKREQVESFDDEVYVTSDNTGKSRINYRWDLEDNQIVQYRPTPDSEWTPMPAKLKGHSIGFWFFEPDNNIAYAEISERGEPAQLYKVNLSAGTRERIAGQPNQEIADFERAGRLGPPVVLRYNAGKPKIDYLDPASPWVQLHSGLMKAFPGQMVSFHSLSRDENKLLFSTWSDRNPGAYYVFDRKTNKPTMLFKAYEHVDPNQMSPMLPLEFKNRGGDTINAFLTTPLGKQGPHALVVMPHGGPLGVHDTWGFDRDAQFLASLGYAVLQVNYRGSSGIGEAFMVKGYQQYGTGIQDDISDAVKHVVAQGLANPNKVCMYGISFGGYSAMMQPIRNPGMYKCAIAYAGVYDLVKQEADKDYSKQMRSFFDRKVGSKETLVAQSPVNQIAKLDVPMLLIHGKSDRVVPIAQYDIALAALNRAGKSVETLVKADEGHGFYKPADVEEALNRIKAFLLKYNPPN